MKLYKLESIRNYMQTKISKTDYTFDLKKSMNEFFSPEFIINRYLLDEVQLYKHYSVNMLIDKDLFEEHLDSFHSNFDLEFSLKKMNRFYAEFQEDEVLTYKINNFPVKFEEVIAEHYSQDVVKLLIQIKKDTLKIEKERKEHFDSVLVEEFPKDLKSSKILSLDFEYDKDKLYEVGISLYDNGITLNKYYITSLKQGTRDNQFRFQFGESLLVSTNTIVHLLKRYLSQADYLLLHGGYNDISILNKFGIELKEFDNIKILDTYYLYPKYFNNGGIDNSSLISILQRFNIEHEHLHNAGNDSYYTLEALLRMNKAYENNEVISDRRKKAKIKM